MYMSSRKSATNCAIFTIGWWMTNTIFLWKERHTPNRMLIDTLRSQTHLRTLTYRHIYIYIYRIYPNLLLMLSHHHLTFIYIYRKPQLYTASQPTSFIPTPTLRGALIDLKTVGRDTARAVSAFFFCFCV